MILRLPINGVAKFTLALFPSILAIFFIFFDASRWIKDISSFLKFRSATLNSPRMRSLIEIRKVENNIIKTDTELAILQITPLNFSIKTTEEKDTIIYGFQKFLNGLDFAVQFVVTTNSLNIDTYLNTLEERATNQELFKDFSAFIKSTIQKNEMRNRNFFLVIPKKSDLDIQCKVCKERLESIGLKTTRLTDKQILNNLHLFFNDVGDERDSVEIADNPLHYLIAPNNVKDEVDSLTINKKFCRVISAVGYPRTVESGFLDKIISTNDDFDISIHMEPFPISTMMVMLNREIMKQRADLFSEQRKNSINPSLEIKFKDTLKVLENLQKGNEKLFNVSLYINCKARTKEELNLLTKKVEAELNSLMIVPNIPLFRQVQGYKSVIPIAKDELQTKRNITTHALSAFFPFTSPFLTLENKGVMLGLNKNKVPFIKDIFALSNANGIVLATSGSGKSYFTKLLISRQLLNNTQVLIIDPQAEYLGLTQHCNGQLITISRDSKTIINPLDLMGHDYIEKRLALMDMFKIMFGELTEIQKSILDKAITQTYKKKKITVNSYENKKPPILGDLYKELLQMDKKASQMEKITYRALINRLYMYTEGVFGFINRQTSINFNNNMVCFNIGDMPKQVKPLVMFMILDFVYMKMKESRQRKLLIIDEAWSLLGKTEEASYIFEIVKTCRKFNMGLLLITQDVADLINSKAGHAVLANSSYTLLLRQKPAIIDSIVKTFHLSQMEKEYLLTATQGKGVLILDNEHQELEVVASPKEHQIITTNPDELNKQEEKQVKPTEDIKMDFEQKLYYGNNLSQEQKNILNNNGYKVCNFVPIGKPRQEEVWIKENSIESLDHTFLVENIKEEIQKHTKDVQLYVTKKPDIIFKNKKGKEMAIEVETGFGFSKHKKRLKEKFFDVYMEYKKDAIIVIAQKSLKDRYTRIAPYLQIIKRTEILEWINKQFR
ncbi:MAG: DUF87 domain-containing protein [Candidatus Cloacimonetes bacterium]|nr:DUF87 domain-containing protein [Candidatus Cloacimonadota bacterium]